MHRIRVSVTCPRMLQLRLTLLTTANVQFLAQELCVRRSSDGLWSICYQNAPEP